MQTVPTTQSPSFHRRKVGDIVVTAILDGTLQGNFDILFEKVATDKILIAGPHLDFPTFPHLERVGNAYAVVSEVWRAAL